MTGDVGTPAMGHFLALERQVWAALLAGDPDADRAMLDADFVGLYESGFADREQHAAQLANGPTIASYELSEERLMVLSDDAVLLMYRADFRAVPDAGPEAMYISSVWCRRGASWLNVFSQDVSTSPA